MGSKKTRLSATDFLREIIEGKFASADRALQKIKTEVKAEDWQKGYINALEGILLASQSRNDKFTFITNLESNGVDKFVKMFTRISREKMQSEFDRGFFSAWAEYMQVLQESNKSKIDFYSEAPAPERNSKQAQPSLKI